MTLPNAIFVLTALFVLSSTCLAQQQFNLEIYKLEPQGFGEGLLTRNSLEPHGPRTGEESESRKKFNAIFEEARDIGLHGRWYVVSSEKDGLFSRAQIGQEVSDVISILPEGEAQLYQPIT